MCYEMGPVEELWSMVFLDIIRSRQPHQPERQGTRYFNHDTEPEMCRPSELRSMTIALADHLGDNPYVRRRIQHRNFLWYPTFPRNSSSERAWGSLAEIVFSLQIKRPMSRLNNSASAFNKSSAPHKLEINEYKKNGRKIFSSQIDHVKHRVLRHGTWKYSRFPKIKFNILGPERNIFRFRGAEDGTCGHLHCKYKNRCDCESMIGAEARKKEGRKSESTESP
jgi:hypothetical protein